LEAHNTNYEEKEDNRAIYIEPIVAPMNISPTYPMTGGNFPFSKMGIHPPLDDRVVDISNFNFDELRDKIIHKIRK